MGDESLISASLFPNPVSETATLQCSFSDKMDNNLQVYNVNGVLVKQFRNVNGHNNLSLNFEDLKSGVYMLRITSPKGETVFARFAKL